MLIRVSREGFEDGRGAREGGGFAQSEDGEIVELSRIPSCFDCGREVFIRDGAWISE